MVLIPDCLYCLDSLKKLSPIGDVLIQRCLGSALYSTLSTLFYNYFNFTTNKTTLLKRLYFINLYV